MDWSVELTRAAVLSTAILAVMAVAELWTRLGHPKPEWTRKLIHVGACIVCISFPFLLRSPLTVLGMTTSLAAFMACGKRFGFLRSLHGVSRESSGTHYYPLAIFLLFWLAHDRPWLYLCSVLVLGISDALAAVIGSQYGKVRYKVDEDTKSLEGSLVFLVASFLAVHLPMLLMTDLPRETCVLVALLAAALATAVEAVSLRGTDNLFVPMVAYLIIDRTVEKLPAELAYLNLSLLAICVVMGLLAWRSRGFNVGGVLAFILFGFTAWSFGPTHWALPFFLGFSLYILMWFLPPRTPSVPAIVVLQALLPAFAVLVAAAGLGRPDLLYGPYIAALTFVLALSLWNRILRKWEPSGWLRRAGAAAVVLPAWVLVAAVPWWFQPGVPFEPLLVIAAVCLPAAFLNDVLIGSGQPPEADDVWPRSRLLLQFAVVGVVILLQLAGLIPLWPPA